MEDASNGCLNHAPVLRICFGGVIVRKMLSGGEVVYMSIDSDEFLQIQSQSQKVINVDLKSKTTISRDYIDMRKETDTISSCWPPLQGMMWIELNLNQILMATIALPIS